MAGYAVAHCNPYLHRDASHKASLWNSACLQSIPAQGRHALCPAHIRSLPAIHTCTGTLPGFRPTAHKPACNPYLHRDARTILTASTVLILQSIPAQGRPFTGWFLVHRPLPALRWSYTASPGSRPVAPGHALKFKAALPSRSLIWPQSGQAHFRSSRTKDWCL